jgi:hypothetical protein
MANNCIRYPSVPGITTEAWAIGLPSRQLIIEATANNIGDTFVNVGARRLVPGLGSGYVQSLPPENYQHDPAWLEERTALSFDVIYIVGTPWFFRGWATSDKSKMLARVVERYPNTPKIMLSPGHCVPSVGYGTVYDSPGLGDSDLVNHMDLIVCRDRYAYDYTSGLSDCADRVVLAKCASHAAYLPEDFGNPPQSGSVCVWMDFASLSGHAGYRAYQALSAITPEQWQSSIDHEATVADAVCVNSARDAEVYTAKFGRPPDMSHRDPHDYAEWVSHFESMVTSRVHSATIGHSLGLDVRLLAADTRADTAYLCGVSSYLDLPATETTHTVTSWDDVNDRILSLRGAR